MKNVFSERDELCTEDVFWMLFDHEVTHCHLIPNLAKGD